jgi:hypothetical protein
MERVCRAVFKLRLWINSPEPDALAFFALGNEFNTAANKGGFNRLHRADAGIYLAFFQPGNCIQRNDGPVSKLLLGPIKQSSCSSNLARTDHRTRKRNGRIFATYRVLMCLIR